MKSAEPFGKLRRGARIDPHGDDAGNPSMNSGDQGQEAPPSRRYARLADGRHRSLRRHSGSRRRRLAAFDAVRPLPFLEKLFADGAYQGPIFADTLAAILPRVKTEIVKRRDQAKGFVTLPKRWIAERSIAWLNRCRRLAKDWENLNATALVFLRFASIRLMLRKLCNS